MTEPQNSVSVRVRGCECPGTPHGAEGDVVFLAPKLSLGGGLQANADIIKAAGNGQILAASWQVTFVKYGAIGWNLVDEDGEPVEFDVDVLLDDYELSRDLADKADDLYGESVMRPLLARLKKISPPGPKNGSTSPTPRLTTKRRGRSSPASTAGSPPLMQ